jgi:hypothetical protein
MTDISRLEKLCGLSADGLAGVLESNPRAYMAVKGAVAEEHLKKYFAELGSTGMIAGIKTAQSDFDKDFYIKLPDGQEVAVECKNVEVLKTNSSKSDYLSYFKYLQELHGEFSDKSFDNEEEFKVSDLSTLYKTLPQNLRESGIPRYEYSASQVTESSIHGGLGEEDFLSQFDHFPLSIDFQRTRNSSNKSNSTNDPKTNRFYELGEVDLVAACLFSRTMKWEFVFGSRNSLIVHPKYKGHYSNRLKLNPKLWKSNFLDVV